MALAKQAGEYLVAGELCRRKYLAATFSGNVRDYDILAVSSSKATFTVQVKTMLRGDFQISDARRFIEIEQDGDQQTVVGKHRLIDDSMWVFVHLHSEDPPAYFISKAANVQDLIYEGYKRNLEKHGGRKPRNPKSYHHALSLSDLGRFHDDWDLIERCLAEKRL